jgi:hypothetical protein
VQSTDYKWLVVLDTEPQSGVRALSPSAIKDKGLDTLHILTRDEADNLGVEVPTRTVNSKTFNASGPGGAAFQSLVDQVSDFTINSIGRLTLKVTADEAKGTNDVDLAVAALGMLPKQVITVKSTVRAEYRGLNGGLQFTGTAERADFQSAYVHAKKSLAGATKVVGDLTLEISFNPPSNVESAEISQIHAVVKSLQMQQTTMTAEVTK